jgi:hypothetical protein
LNRHQDAFGISEHVIVPESKHSVTFDHQAAITDRVGGRLIMLPTIHFDNQPPFSADKVADVTKYRLLPHKLVPIDLPVANTIPEDRFRICLIDA